MIREVGVLLFLLLSLRSIQFAEAGAPAIVLRPAVTTAGSAVGISGSGFTPTWTAWVFSPDFGDQMCCFMTSSTGSFEVNYTLPSDLQPGVYTIRAVDQKGTIADAKITVVSQASSTSTIPEFPWGSSTVVLVAALIAAVLIATAEGRLRLPESTP
jgi:hypothetical protein